MRIKAIHLLSGLIISSFVGLHLFNHLWSVFGADKHIEMMGVLRRFYRNIIAETILLLSIVLQIYSGIKLFFVKRKLVATFFEKLQLWTGLYLAVFLVVHLAAIFGVRYFFGLDTNFYFGVAGINSFPINLFFIPYYSLAIISFFGHIAAIHSLKNNIPILGLSPKKQGITILIIGYLLTVILFYGFTNGFKGIKIPEVYRF